MEIDKVFRRNISFRFDFRKTRLRQILHRFELNFWMISSYRWDGETLVALVSHKSTFVRLRVAKTRLIYGHDESGREKRGSGIAEFLACAQDLHLRNSWNFARNWKSTRKSRFFEYKRRVRNCRPSESPRQIGCPFPQVFVDGIGISNGIKPSSILRIVLIHKYIS